MGGVYLPSNVYSEMRVLVWVWRKAALNCAGVSASTSAEGSTIYRPFDWQGCLFMDFLCWLSQGRPGLLQGIHSNIYSVNMTQNWMHIIKFLSQTRLQFGKFVGCLQFHCYWIHLTEYVNDEHMWQLWFSFSSRTPFLTLTVEPQDWAWLSHSSLTSDPVLLVRWWLRAAVTERCLLIAPGLLKVTHLISRHTATSSLVTITIIDIEKKLASKNASALVYLS